MSWKRIALYAVALNLLLFFRGCDQTGEVKVTAGAFIPYQTVEIAEGGFVTRIELASFSLPLLALNFALCATLLLLIKKYMPKLDAFLARRAFLIIAGFSFVLFNLVLIPNYVWLYAVFWPTGYLHEAATTIFHHGDPSSVPLAYIDIAARLYFLLLIAVLSLIPLLCFWIKRKLAAAPGPSCLTGHHL